MHAHTACTYMQYARPVREQVQLTLACQEFYGGVSPCGSYATVVNHTYQQCVNTQVDSAETHRATPEEGNG